MKSIKSALLGLALLGVAAAAHAQNEQFIPMTGVPRRPVRARRLRLSTAAPSTT